jgi:hypothetical protein
MFMMIPQRIPDGDALDGRATAVSAQQGGMALSLADCGLIAAEPQVREAIPRMFQANIAARRSCQRARRASRASAPAFGVAGGRCENRQGST